MRTVGEGCFLPILSILRSAKRVRPLKLVIVRGVPRRRAVCPECPSPDRSHSDLYYSHVSPCKLATAVTERLPSWIFVLRLTSHAVIEPCVMVVFAAASIAQCQALTTLWDGNAVEY